MSVAPQTRPRGRSAVLNECLAMRERYGFVTYQAVADALGVSRQYVYQALQKLRESGALSEAEYQALRPPARTPKAQNVSSEYSLTPDNHEFVHALAKQLRIFPASVVNHALNVYRRALQPGAPP